MKRRLSRVAIIGSPLFKRGVEAVMELRARLQCTHTTEAEVLTNNTPIPVMACAVLKCFHKRRLTIVNPPGSDASVKQ